MRKYIGIYTRFLGEKLSLPLSLKSDLTHTHTHTQFRSLSKYHCCTARAHTDR